ncbi:MAG: hypothetical protein JKY92_00460 [Magnetovibrio sp.]|nr:hypothetical protein [Magnetovibrio sp.]
MSGHTAQRSARTSRQLPNGKPILLAFVLISIALPVYAKDITGCGVS